MARHEVHLINLSLGGQVASEIEHDAILDAMDRGTVILAAAGNKARAVEYPAAHSEVVAVSALGREGEGSTMARDGAYKLATDDDPHENELYPANFACFGPEVDCVAPGVDIISTVPSPTDASCSFGVMSGTSMSTPIVTATLAVLLAKDPEYLRMGAVRERADYALKVLRECCRDLGFPQDRQGDGLPTLS